MDNANTRTNIDDFLTVRGFAGGYGGYGFGGGQGLYAGNSVLAADAHANGTAVKEAVDCNGRAASASLDRISDQNQETRRIFQNESLRDGQFQAELRGSDRLRDLERMITNNAAIAAQCCCDTKAAIAEAAKEAAKCCCEAQLQQCKDTAALSALIIKENSATRELMNSSALAAANAKIVQLETINALSNRHHHHG